ncbi:hypothetical protein AKJ09_10593 [Labilithrix luteola]|uniref:Uncharacterized protein n=1 Tax=Labilithrix luteola TaxID=1391654 RepID=A0A0K1QER8_9BACT|nr:hypothetical protein AKJ09_10593 [Labilithrix luteola]
MFGGRVSSPKVLGVAGPLGFSLAESDESLPQAKYAENVSS